MPPPLVDDVAPGRTLGGGGVRGPARAGRTYLDADLEAVRGDAVGRADGVGGGPDRQAPGSKDTAPGHRRVAACNGAMGSPKHARAIEASQPVPADMEPPFLGPGTGAGQPDWAAPV